MKRSVYQFVMVVAIMLACHGQAFSNVVENNDVVATSDSDADGYIYTPLVKDGVMWKYVHSGMNYDHTEPYVFETYCYISGTVEVDGKLYHKCFVENPNLDDVCVAYLREEDKRVYMMSVWEEKDREIYFYQTGGKEELIYDFNLNVGDTYVSNGANLEVKDVKYEEMDGVLRKVYEVYAEKHFDSGYMESHTYTIVEGIGVIANWCGLFCFPYIDEYSGGAYPVYDQQIFHEYTPLVREGVEWSYFTGDTAEEVDFYRLRLSGEEEINGNIYKKCWCYTDCEFDESTAVLYGYLREEDKRVYVLYQNAGSEYLLYDFNLQEGDEYGQHPWFNGAVTLPIESVDYVLTTEGLRKRYFVGSNVCYIEGIGIVGTHLGDMLRPNDYPYVENATFNYEKNQGNNVVYQQTDNEIGFTDPCINYGASYEYTPLVEEGKVWHYTESWGWLAVIDNARVAMRGQDVINGKVYTKCWLYYDHCEFSEDDAMLLCYMREKDKRVYMIPAVDSEHCPSFFLGYESYASDIADAQEYLLYDFNLSAGDSYCEVPDYNNEWLYHTIESVDFIEIDGKLRKKYVLSNSHNVIEGIGIIGDFSGYVCSPNPMLPTCSYTTPRLSHITLDNETIFLYYGGDPCLSNDDPNTIKVEKIGDLTLYQTGDVVTIGGAIGKVDMAIYVLDGVKLAEASGNGSATLLTYELPIGIYVVKATDSTGNRLTQKIVVK